MITEQKRVSWEQIRLVIWLLASKRQKCRWLPRTSGYNLVKFEVWQKLFSHEFFQHSLSSCRPAEMKMTRSTKNEGNKFLRSDSLLPTRFLKESPNTTVNVKFCWHIIIYIYIYIYIYTWTFWFTKYKEGPISHR